MKRRALEKQLRERGWRFDRHGGRHDVWLGPDGSETQVPRHAEINEQLARAILRAAQAAAERSRKP